MAVLFYQKIWKNICFYAKIYTIERGINMLRIAICDDEAAIGGYIEKVVLASRKIIEDTIKVEVFISGERMIQYIKNEHAFDLIFLDIQLEGLNGVKVGEIIRNELNDYNTKIVFISGREDYAMQLFNVHPMNFLIKPLKRDDIVKCIQVALNMLKPGGHVFQFSYCNVHYSLFYKDIMYFSFYKRKVRIVTIDNEYYTYLKLSEIMKIVKASNFILVHQSYYVNANFVKEYKFDRLIMKNNEVLPVSKSRKADVRTYFLDWGSDDEC